MSFCKRSPREHDNFDQQPSQAWSPNTDSFHYRIYRKWLRRKGYLDRQEDNPYRYWRIVGFWSPLEAIKPLLVIIMSIACLLGAAGFVALMVIELVANNGVLLVAIGFLALYCLLGIIAWGIYLWSPYSISWGPKSDYVVLPAMAITGIFVYAGRYLAVASTWLYRRAMRTPIGNQLQRLRGQPWLNWWQLTWLAPLALLVVGFWFPIAWAYLISGTVIIAIPGLVLLLTYLSEKSEKLKSRQLEIEINNYKMAQMDLFLRRLYEIQHPRHASDDERYSQWQARYTNWFYDYVKYDKSRWYVLNCHLSVSDSLHQKYCQLYGSTEGQINGLPVVTEILSNRQASSYRRLVVKLFDGIRGRRQASS